MHHPCCSKLLLLLACATAAAWAGDRIPPPLAGSAAPATPRQAIRSPHQLEAWLQSTTNTPTPLDALSPEGRRRFLDALVWGETGLGSFGTDDLGWELTPEQIHQVLALFDATQYQRMVPPLRPAAGWPPRTSSAPSMIEQGFDLLVGASNRRQDESDLQHDARIHDLYLARFGKIAPAQIAKLSDRDLLLFLRATYLTSLASSDRPALEGANAGLAEAMRRKLGSPALGRLGQQALLSAGQLEQARRLAHDHPQLGLMPIPDTVRAKDVAAGTPSWWRLDPISHRMIEEPADLAPLQILVLGGCHFSADAADDIAGDPALAPVFARHAHWLGQPPGSEDIQAWIAWNTQRPQTPMQLITDRASWALFEQWNMPTFAIVRDGRVIDQTSGSWRDHPHNRSALVTMLRRHGLMPPRAQIFTPATIPSSPAEADAVSATNAAFALRRSRD